MPRVHNLSRASKAGRAMAVMVHTLARLARGSSSLLAAYWKVAASSGAGRPITMQASRTNSIRAAIHCLRSVKESKRSRHCEPHVSKKIASSHLCLPQCACTDRQFCHGRNACALLYALWSSHAPHKGEYPFDYYNVKRFDAFMVEPTLDLLAES